MEAESEVFRCAISQPSSGKNQSPETYIETMTEMIVSAAAQGANLVVFPQGWPGAHVPATVAAEGIDLASDLARKHSIAVIYGSRRQARDDGYFLTAITIDEDGSVVDEYRRSSPPGPFYYPSFDVTYVGGDSPPRSMQLKRVSLAVVMCAEIYVPELSRLAMLAGAELIVNPTCCENGPPTWPTWQKVVEARALENLCYVAACQDLRRPGRGLGIVAGPRGVLVAADGPGPSVVELDLGLVRKLRAANNGDPDAMQKMQKETRIFGGGLYYRRPEFFAPLLSK